ncbi:MAG: hypothetical protein OEW78_08380 [Nitrosopumilus sp.]|uniref:hypothetical protein n=1 Tax=Nitrosopumilus sp. TaxID=2024843 RepID=UPI00246E8B76|nr:hypothetical protein [Nitrosopumilus sp.]MDH5431878.1 hypothetical protein [Nitrosopumilus sp.]
MNIQTQKIKQDITKSPTKWNRIKRERLRKLSRKTEEELADLLLSIPEARFQTWCQSSGVGKCGKKQIFYKAIIQSWIGCELKESYSNLSFYRDTKAEYTDRIYKVLFEKQDPRLEVAEEICKYLEC